MKPPLIAALLLASAAPAPARAQQASALANPPANAPAGWQEARADDLAREPRRHFTLPGKFLPPVPANANAANPPSLLLKCAAVPRSTRVGKFRVGAVVVGLPLEIHMVELFERKGGLSYLPEVAVSYRLDEGKAVTDDWPPRADKTSAEFDKSEFRKMLRARTLLVNLSDKDGGELRLQFDLPDPAAPAAPGSIATAEVARACGVPAIQP